VSRRRPMAMATASRHPRGVTGYSRGIAVATNLLQIGGGNLKGAADIGPEDTFDGDYGRLLERAMRNR
jgi:hypothetical protein